MPDYHVFSSEDLTLWTDHGVILRQEDDGEIYESIEDIWPDYPSKDDFFWNEDEY